MKLGCAPATRRVEPAGNAVVRTRHAAARGSPTTTIDVVRGCFAEAIARGHEAAALCARFGISPEELGDAEARVPTSVTRRIWQELPGLLDASDFGLDVARRAEAVSAFGILGHVLLSAETAAQGLGAAIRYQRLLTDAVDLRWSETTELVRLTIVTRDPALAAPRLATEFFFGSMILAIRAAIGSALTPRELAFRHAKPDDDSEARRVFGCRPTYSASLDEVAFARADLELPIQSSDPYLSRVLLTHAAQLDERLSQTPSFSARVRRAITDSMQLGEVGVGEIARRLRQSPRSLQRRLRDEGTSYKEVLDDLRRDFAKRHIEEGKLTQQQIAFFLGFSQQSGFHRAFLRWMGRSPSAYRAATRNGFASPPSG
jgi:AraC-like DNA-binding protein